MMDNLEWMITKLDDLHQKSNTYNDQAFYLALKDLVCEQHKRQAQLQRELDGRMWSE